MVSKKQILTALEHPVGSYGEETDVTVELSLSNQLLLPFSSTQPLSSGKLSKSQLVLVWFRNADLKTQYLSDLRKNIPKGEFHNKMFGLLRF